MSGLVDPIIADLQMEHAAAVLDRHRWKTVWIRIVAGVALLRALPLRAIGHGHWSRALRLIGLAAPTNSEHIAVSYYSRVAFSCAPVALALFALAVLTRSRVFRFISGGVVLAAYFGYLFALDASAARDWSAVVTPPVASWLPNFTVMALSMSMLLVSRLKPAPTTDS